MMGWNDLNEEERTNALKDDLFFASLKVKYPDADFSERDNLLNKYKVKLVCKFCDTEVEENLLKPSYSVICPECKRASLNIEGYDFGKPNPSFIADWLLKHYNFLTTKDQDAEIYIYDNSSGTWSTDKAASTIEYEAKMILQNKLRVQDIANIKLHLRAQSYKERNLLGSAVRSKDKIKINLRNGVLSIGEKVEFTGHSPDDYFMGVLPIDFNPASEGFPKKIMDFLWGLCENPYDFITLLEGLAYPLLPGYPIQQALTLIGTGGNGKSTYLALLQMLYGDANVASVTLQQLSTAVQQQPFLLSRLYGKLLNVADDLPNKPVADVGFFKQLTGGSTVEAEHKFGGRFSFVNEAKFYFAANQMPAVSDDTIAYWRRFCFVEFTKRITNPRPIDEVLNEFRKELPDLFNVLVGVILPQMIGKSTFTFADTPEITQDIYQRNSNSAALFAQTEIEIAPEEDILKSDFLIAYQKWCEEHDYIQVSEKKFWQTIKMEYPQAVEKKVQRDGRRIRTIVGLRISSSQNTEDNNNSNTMLEKEAKLRLYLSNLSNMSNMSNIFLFLCKIKDNIKYYISKREIPDIPDIPDTSSKPDASGSSTPLPEAQGSGSTGAPASAPDSLPASDSASSGIFISKPEKCATERKITQDLSDAAAAQQILHVIESDKSGVLLGKTSGTWDFLYSLIHAPKEQVDKLMRIMLKVGDIMEPKPGEFKVVKNVKQDNE